MAAEDIVRQHFDASISVKREAAGPLAPAVARAAALMTSSLISNGKILSCGNGGSAGDAQHFSAEMLNRFEMERPGLPALALTTDSSTLTSIANDYSYAEVFAKQVKAIGRPGDAALGLSTSGNSDNVVRALGVAREMGLKTLALSGRDGGPVAAAAELAVVVPSWSTPRVQEVHITIGHVLCDLVDFLLYPEKFHQE